MLETGSGEIADACVMREKRTSERRSGERRNYYNWRAYMWRNSALSEFDRRKGQRRTGADRRAHTASPVDDAAEPD